MREGNTKGLKKIRQSDNEIAILLDATDLIKERFHMNYNRIMVLKASRDFGSFLMIPNPFTDFICNFTEVKTTGTEAQANISRRLFIIEEENGRYYFKENKQWK